MSETTDELTMPLDEFCRTVSLTDRRVELLAVFRDRERRAGREHDTEGNYAARWSATETSPTAA